VRGRSSCRERYGRAALLPSPGGGFPRLRPQWDPLHLRADKSPPDWRGVVDPTGPADTPLGVLAAPETRRKVLRGHLSPGLRCTRPNPPASNRRSGALPVAVGPGGVDPFEQLGGNGTVGVA
jgi:hypothetical protein